VSYLRNLVVTPAQHVANLAQNARDGLDSAGHNDQQIRGALDALTSAIGEAGQEYQWLWEDRNLLARQVADRRDDTDTRLKAAVIEAFRTAARDYGSGGADDPISDTVALHMNLRANLIELGEVTP